uniref:Mediator of RNA polymerase II transcription subunit 7 n=1 Tax=Panagrellus redivivus TaxID=6233 RepID=A0A7E4V8X1_PANRE
MAYPNPPIYAKYYSERAILRKRCPPPPPIPRQFVVFGEQYNLDEPIMKSLPELGQVQLYEVPQTMGEFKKELKKINSSIMAVFLDLMQLLINNTNLKHRHQVFENLRVMFINMHHLINECRTAQGYATLVVTQVERMKQLRGVKAEIENQQGNIRNLLLEAQKLSPKVEIPFDLEELRKTQTKTLKRANSIDDAFDSKLTSRRRPVTLLKSNDIAELMQLRKSAKPFRVI